MHTYFRAYILFGLIRIYIIHIRFLQRYNKHKDYIYLLIIITYKYRYTNNTAIKCDNYLINYPSRALIDKKSLTYLSL